MHSLPLFHRVAGERVVLVGEGDMAAAKRRLIERAGALCCGEDDAEDARLAFVALDDSSKAEPAAIRLKARGLLVNVADRPELCDFTLPSVLERGEVLVAIGTGGASAGLAKHLRLRFEAFLPPSLGALASGLRQAREALRTRWPDPADRRRAIDLALAERGRLDPFDANSADRIAAWIANPKGSAPRGAVAIDLTSDDPDDLTLRQARLLGMADTVLHDADVSPGILIRARADAVRGIIGECGEPREGLTVLLRRSPGSAKAMPASGPAGPQLNLAASPPNSSK